MDSYKIVAPTSTEPIPTTQRTVENGQSETITTNVKVPEVGVMFGLEDFFNNEVGIDIQKKVEYVQEWLDNKVKSLTLDGEKKIPSYIESMFKELGGIGTGIGEFGRLFSLIQTLDRIKRDGQQAYGIQPPAISKL